ncbi:MAG: hypothetical protein AB7S78_13560 [Candidatus Omnitrophota bacterium]
MKKLVQKYPSGKNTFEVDSGGVNVHLERWFSSHRYIVPFEEVTAHPVEVGVSSKGWFTAGAICLMFLVLCVWFGFGRKDAATLQENLIAWSSGTIISVGMYLLSRRTFILFSTGSRELALLKNNPSQKAVDLFVVAMLQQKREYVRNAYLPSSDGLPIVTQLNNLSILKKNGDITEEEFILLKERIINRNDPEDDNLDGPEFGFGDN